MWRDLADVPRPGVEGIAATASDLATLNLLVSALHMNVRAASVPAFAVGGVVTFFGNRCFAFRAAHGDARREAAGSTRPWSSGLSL